MDSSHWERQYERWGIKTNGYREAKRNEYQRLRQGILIERKRREIISAVAHGGIPQGRLDHLAAQIERITNVQAR